MLYETFKTKKLMVPLGLQKHPVSLYFPLILGDANCVPFHVPGHEPEYPPTLTRKEGGPLTLTSKMPKYLVLSKTIRKNGEYRGGKQKWATFLCV